MHKHRKKFQATAKIIFLYHTKVGMKFIDYVGGKYKKILHVLSYVILGVDYLLMTGVVYYLVKSVYVYIKYPIIAEVTNNAPPLALLIPYFPKIFGYESFFPPFYFTYFVLVLAVVLVVHEFSHGIFMKKNNVRIKSTGLLFLGPMLSGAFVEQDDKQMVKKSKFAQMSILGAGVFANIVFAGIFLLLLIGMFSLTFVPSGAIFTGYAIGQINPNQITEIGGIQVDDLSNQGLLNLIEKKNITDDSVLEGGGNSLEIVKIIANGETYYMDVDALKMQFEENFEKTNVYLDLPAIDNVMKGVIIEVNGNEIKTSEDLSLVLKDKKPGEDIDIKTRYGEEILEYDLVMGEGEDGRGVIGIEMRPPMKLRVDDQIGNWFGFKDPFTEYKTPNDFFVFIYYAIFWLFLVNTLVAFVNMLPLGVLDGGRFFYLTIGGITRKEKIAKLAYRGVTWLILLGLILMMITWLIRIII